jgi:UPF0755 protein
VPQRQRRHCPSREDGALIGRILKLLVVLAVIGGLAAGAGWWRLRQWGDEPVTVDGFRVVEFPAGTPLISLAQALDDQSLVTSGVAFFAWVRLFGSYQGFQAGKYRFEGRVTPRDIEAKIKRGEVYNPIVLSVTIPEGFPLRQVIDRLAANKVGTADELTRLAHDPTTLRSLNVPGRSLEGFLYPATYNFTKKPSALEVFQTMVKTFWEKLPKDYESRVKAMGLTLDSAVTFASLIELETLNDDEKSLISEVIWRRLKDDVPLAIDAAIIYGITDYAGDLKRIHLSDKNNPYNTRIHKGLPPSAIGAPSADSLEAVLNPSSYGYYYYVLIPGTQRHHFSRTLKEHNENVKKLVKASKRTHAKAAAATAQPPAGDD